MYDIKTPLCRIQFNPFNMRLISIGYKNSPSSYYINHQEHVRSMRNDITFTYTTTYTDKPRQDFIDKWMKKLKEESKYSEEDSVK